METLPALERVSDQEQDARIVALWAEVPRLPTRLAEWAAKLREPVKDARHASVPPSHARKATPPIRPPKGTRREARVGRAGGGRPLHPHPDQVIIAQAKGCSHCGQAVSAAAPSLPAVYEQIELPPIKAIVTRVEPYGGRCARCGQTSVAPVPTARDPGTPWGASVQRLATSLRSTHASRDERLSALLAQVCGLDIREGGLANLVQGVKGRLDQRVADILTRWRSSRLVCREATRARVHGRQPWAWGFQNAAVCLHVIRPRRGPGVIPNVLGAPRPTIWVSDL